MKIDGDRVTMHVEEYRWFVTRVKALEAENAALSRNLIAERASFDVLSQQAASTKEAVKRERAEADARIAELAARVRAYDDKKWIPGVVAGGGPTTGGGLQGFIGLGWKVDLR